MAVKERTRKIGPQVLTMEHLSIGFISWLILLALSFQRSAFLIEIGNQPVRKLIREAKSAIAARVVSSTSERSIGKAFELRLRRRLVIFKALSPEDILVIGKTFKCFLLL